MDYFVIKGNNKLKGKVKISGSKNAALPIMFASLLTAGKTTLHNIPRLQDIFTSIKLLEILGAKTKFSRNKLEIDTTKISNYEAPYNLVRKMRASVLLAGPLAIRKKKAIVSLPGGCAIGLRPIDQHLKGFEALGMKIEHKHGRIHLRADKIKGNEIYFDLPTVCGTENIMMAAVCAKGTTHILNAAREPEVQELAIFLNKMGADIRGYGTSHVTIYGVKELKAVEHTVIPDRIEAGTFMIASIITRSNIEIINVVPEHLYSIETKLIEAGAKIDVSENTLQISAKGDLKPVSITTLPYPGFPTDMQAQFMSLMSVTPGNSVINETVFENRFMHAAELERMGADIAVEGHTAFIRGKIKLSGSPVMATDLRASAALVLAGLVAQGETIIRRVYHIDRGYENIEKKLSKLGADIKRRKE